jgi:hypothetical protein
MFSEKAQKSGKGKFCGFELRRLVRPAVALLAGIVLLGGPTAAMGQHGGGGGGGGGRGIGGGSGISVGRPDGVSEKDDLKDFHRALALQATPEQIAAFRKVAQYTQTAGDQLQSFREALRKGMSSPPIAERAAAVSKGLARARAGNQNFLTSFSDAQKSGLQDLTKKLAKSESELDKQSKLLDEAGKNASSATEPLASAAAALEKELGVFQNEQLALGREMGILLSDENVAFKLPAVNNSINIAGQSIALPTSGTASRVSAENGKNVYGLELTSDLSDLQQNIFTILRPAMARSPRCGERVQLQEASLTPAVPGAVVIATLHYERWACALGSRSEPTEVDEAEATLEVKLTPAVRDTGVTLSSAITRVQAEGFLRNSLRSGDLGANLREQIAASLLSIVQQATDFKTTLPPTAQLSATLQKIQFQDAGADELGLIIDGSVQLSDEQAKQFAVQLRQNVSARSNAAQ